MGLRELLNTEQLFREAQAVRLLAPTVNRPSNTRPTVKICYNRSWCRSVILEKRRRTVLGVTAKFF